MRLDGCYGLSRYIVGSGGSSIGYKAIAEVECHIENGDDGAVELRGLVAVRISSEKIPFVLTTHMRP